MSFYWQFKQIRQVGKETIKLRFNLRKMGSRDIVDTLCGYCGAKCQTGMINVHVIYSFPYFAFI